MSEQTNMTCAFCGGPCAYRYHMGEYAIWQCQLCRTGRAHPLPDMASLCAFYDGFLTHLTLERYPRILAAGRTLFADFGATPNRPQRLLDIGGGGGFFCKAYEELGFGESTYIDLDPQSCAFAREQLGLTRVIHGDALALDVADGAGFDIIYSRHLLEHLIDPISFLTESLKLLAPAGRLVTQIPNGNSLEYFAYPAALHGGRFGVISASNGWRLRQVWRDALTNGMLHGIDPPRHLWAITEAGMQAWARAAGATCRVRYYPLWNLPYSPHFNPTTRKKVWQGWVGKTLLAPLRGGTHLVAIMQRG